MRQVPEKKCILAIIVLEVVLVLAVSVGSRLTYQDKSVHFAQEDMLLLETEGSSPGSYLSYLDPSYEDALAVITPEVDLPSGIYYVEAVYEVSGPAYAGLSYTVPREDQELVNGDEFALNQMNDRVSYKANIKDGTGIRFQIRLTGDAEDGDYIQLRETRIVRSELSWLYPAACLVVFLLVLDLLGLLFIYWRKQDDDSRIIIPVLVIVAFLLGLPLYQPGIVGGIDLPFHMNRIEGIYEGLKEGQFPVRIQPGWLNGYGYAVSVFYGDILLYFPAVLRLVGFSLQDAMKAYLIAVTFLTVFAAYFSFRKCLRCNAAAFTASVLYAGAGDRLIRFYGSSQIGAVSAMIFYPVVFAGLYLLFTREKQNRADRTWLWLLAGFSGLLMTHLLSCIMIGIFAAVSCLLCIRRLLRRDVLREAGKAFASWILLNAWFLVPFVQYMTMNFSVTSKLSENVGAVNYHVELAGYLKDALSVSDIFSARGIGYSLTLVFFSSLFVVGGGKESDDRRKEFWLILGLAVCAGFFSMKAFPVIGLSKISGLFMKLFQTVQYGDRFLSVAVLFLSSLGGYLILAVKDKYRLQVVAMFCGLTLLQSILMLDGYAADWQMLEPVDLGYSLVNIGNGEYVPEGTDLSALDKTLSYDNSAIQVENVGNRYLVYRADVRNPGQTEQAISFPMLYYAGYQCGDLESKKSLKTYAGENNRVTVEVPAGYSGTLRVSFEEYWYWRAAEICSLITFVVITSYFIKKLSVTGRREYENDMEETG